MLEACPGLCELKLFCSNFDGTLLPILARVFIDVAQVIQGFFNKESLRAATNVWNCNRKATGFFALTVEVNSRGFEVPDKKDPIANQRALKVQEATWADGAGGATGAKSTWDRGSKDTRAACVESTVTEWGFVDCNIALDATVVGI